MSLAAHLAGLCAPEVDVLCPGGTLRVAVAPDLSLTMTGPAQFVYSGQWLAPAAD